MTFTFTYYNYNNLTSKFQISNHNQYYLQYAEYLRSFGYVVLCIFLRRKYYLSRTNMANKSKMKNNELMKESSNLEMEDRYEESGEELEVEKILGRRVLNGVVQYII